MSHISIGDQTLVEYSSEVGTEDGIQYLSKGFTLPGYTQFQVRIEVVFLPQKYDRELYILAIYVAEGLRSKGLGSQLLRRVIELARNWKARVIRLHRGDESFLYSWYTKHGFVCRNSHKGTPYRNMRCS
jgi:GNAT superfamily N-acetyltransferase